MTDEICPIESCTFPLMSSKNRSLQFCTFHDALPTGAAKDSYKSKAVEEKVDDDMSDELAIRRHRREQSSKASQLIGQKMLQRWALLNEHCPNESCYAVSSNVICEGSNYVSNFYCRYLWFATQKLSTCIVLFVKISF